jgi:hypothetical protein
MSAYCTTQSGIILTTKKWSWQELGYKSNEFIITINNNTQIKSIFN